LMSRWSLSRRMRDLRWWGVRCRDGRCRAECATYGGGVFDVAMVDVAQNARPTVVGADVAMVDVAQNARRTVVGADVAMVVVAQDARPTVVGADVAMNDVAQDARPTAVGCSMSRWLMSRKMRDVRWGDV